MTDIAVAAATSLARALAGDTPVVVTFDTPVPYEVAVHLQEALVAAVYETKAAPVLLLLEHPLVATLGRSADPAVAAGALMPVVRSARGGSVTVHGPGQVVGYPIVDLRRTGVGVHAFVRDLEQWLCDVARSFGAPAYTRDHFTGLWTDAGKLASIGIAVRRGVSWHGVALYVEDQTANFGALTPCALPNVRPDALAAYCPDITWSQVAAALSDGFAARQGTTPHHAALRVSDIMEAYG